MRRRLQSQLMGRWHLMVFVSLIFIMNSVAGNVQGGREFHEFRIKSPMHQCIVIGVAYCKQLCHLHGHVFGNNCCVMITASGILFRDLFRQGCQKHTKVARRILFAVREEVA